MYSNTNLINATGKYLFNKHIYLKVRTALSRRRSKYCVLVAMIADYRCDLLRANKCNGKILI